MTNDSRTPAQVASDEARLVRLATSAALARQQAQEQAAADCRFARYWTKA